MVDPTRNEAAALRKKIDAVNRALKPLGQSCLRKVNQSLDLLETECCLIINLRVAIEFNHDLDDHIL